MFNSNQRTPDRILAIARKMPSGIIDEKAGEKLLAELKEFSEKIKEGDHIGGLLEAADVLCYLTKVKYLGMLPGESLEDTLVEVCLRGGFTFDQVYDACITKYTLRTRPGNPKDDEDERQAVAHLLEI